MESTIRYLVTILVLGASFIVANAFALRESNSAAVKLVPHHITLAGGSSFELYLATGFDISVAAQGVASAAWPLTLRKASGFPTVLVM